MAANFSQGGLAVTLSWTYGNGLSIGGATSGSNIGINLQTTAGSSTGGTIPAVCDLLYVVSGTIAGSGSVNIDLAGSVSDFFGNLLTFARVKQFCVILQAGLTQASSVLIGNGTNPFINWVGAGAHTVRVRGGVGGGALALGTNDATGYVVAASTGDIFKILNEDASNSAAYQAGFSGCST